jgi:hypothetical protein
MRLAQVLGLPLPFTRGRGQLGSSVLSVMGVSFASVPLYQSVITSMMATGVSFEVAFGRLLGTTGAC